MCGNKEWFIELDDKFRGHVKLGDDRTMSVEARGNVRLEINGVISVLTSVYYIPRLKNNLFSVGQLHEKGLKIVIKDDICEVWNKCLKKLVMHSAMSKNRMSIILAIVKGPKEVTEAQCLQVIEKTHQLWHKRFGHLSQTGLKCLAEKKMVIGLPNLNKEETKPTACDVCMKGKQNRESIPKNSLWK